MKTRAIVCISLAAMLLLTISAVLCVASLPLVPAIISAILFGFLIGVCVMAAIFTILTWGDDYE